ncbi:hypothetical protein BTUL_0025g00390 [Botrytis tulipae]|uniref:Uncharacterized protein n=1 Tax=Botrytis tulipae TaxID=87230 RepID=A0A4Z1EZJ3_9HELO|nr:hypothetical protein BTUL_0025g00390 [Botrytis tulipae]
MSPDLERLIMIVVVIVIVIVIAIVFTLIGIVLTFFRFEPHSPFHDDYLQRSRPRDNLLNMGSATSTQGYFVLKTLYQGQDLLHPTTSKMGDNSVRKRESESDINS